MANTFDAEIETSLDDVGKVTFLNLDPDQRRFVVHRMQEKDPTLTSQDVFQILTSDRDTADQLIRETGVLELGVKELRATQEPEAVSEPDLLADNPEEQIKFKRDREKPDRVIGRDTSVDDRFVRETVRTHEQRMIPLPQDKPEVDDIVEEAMLDLRGSRVRWDSGQRAEWDRIADFYFQLQELGFEKEDAFERTRSFAHTKGFGRTFDKSVQNTIDRLGFTQPHLTGPFKEGVEPQGLLEEEIPERIDEHTRFNFEAMFNADRMEGEEVLPLEERGRGTARIWKPVRGHLDDAAEAAGKGHEAQESINFIPSAEFRRLYSDLATGDYPVDKLSAIIEEPGVVDSFLGWLDDNVFGENQARRGDRPLELEFDPGFGPGFFPNVPLDREKIPVGTREDGSTKYEWRPIFEDVPPEAKHLPLLKRNEIKRKMGPFARTKEGKWVPTYGYWADSKLWDDRLVGGVQDFFSGDDRKNWKRMWEEFQKRRNRDE